MKKILIFFVIGLFAFVTVSAVAGDFKANQKQEFFTSLRGLSEQLAQIRAISNKMYLLYFNLGYQSGGSNPIVIGDLTGTQFEGMSVAEITNVITALNNLETWFAGGNADNLSKIAIPKIQ